MLYFGVKKLPTKCDRVKFVTNSMSANTPAPFFFDGFLSLSNYEMFCKNINISYLPHYFIQWFLNTVYNLAQNNMQTSFIMKKK